MTITITQRHASFVGEASSIDLSSVYDEPTLQAIRDGMSKYAVLIFRNQRFTNEGQLEFAQRLDGELHAKTSSAALTKNRYGNEALTDISNVGADGDILAANDRRRMNGISNRIWHTDASFEDPSGRYSLLFARNLPPVRADTQFADTRTAYDDLDDDTKAKIENLHAHHSIVYSRHTMGFDFSAEESAKLPGATHRLVRHFAENNRKALYVASHASRIVEWPIPEGRLLLRDLIEHATREKYIFSHEWMPGDLVIWDNRASLHRARPFDDVKYKRELTRVTTLDLPRSPVKKAA